MPVLTTLFKLQDFIQRVKFKRRLVKWSNIASSRTAKLYWQKKFRWSISKRDKGEPE